MLLFENYFWLIYIAAFLSAIISASIGFIGGTALFAVMAQFLKMEVLIPLHAITQLASNSTRTWILFKHINWKISYESIVGAVLGGIAGYFYLTPLPENWFNLILGLFIIATTIFPRFQANFNFPGKWILVGFLSCSLGLYMGAIGILVGSFLLAEKLDKKPMIATQSVLQSVVHLTKIIVFCLLGFSLSKWSLLIIGSIICAYLGTRVGSMILNIIPEKIFRKIVTGLIFILATKLVIDGGLGVFGF